MPQSLSDVLIHVVYCTKNRVPYLKSPDLREHLNGFIVGTLKEIGCASLITRSVEDHVHTLCQLSRTMSIAELVKQMKVTSSGWIKEQDPRLAEFYWQAGYGAFSVSHSNRDQVKHYIGHQEEHHQTRTYQDEFRLLLERHGIEYDERYVWD